jgi:hypothetical protein
MKRLIKIKFLSESHQIFRCKFGIQGINLTRLPRRQINDKKRNDRDKKEGDQFLKKASYGKWQHGYITPFRILVCAPV